MRGSATAARAAVGACALLLVFSALAQEAQSPNRAPGPESRPAESPNGSRPFSPCCRRCRHSRTSLKRSAVGWTKEPTKFRTDMQGAQETFDKLGNQTRDAAKDATDAMIGLPNARIVTARERCAAARNGSPDCQAAVDTFCRGKGFQVRKEPRYPVGAEMSGQSSCSRAARPMTPNAGRRYSSRARCANSGADAMTSSCLVRGVPISN